eukprot:TRINITY_DN7400_c0_g1_i2.p5 TRINITY_DN7400_c0_g1~~TRINITY_DN7400_c0_g1_i2.p5  ORF type:complete len:105 (+),score=6.45 TRINITY_DN7400_c0_g1_i2:79-393(+)
MTREEKDDSVVKPISSVGLCSSSLLFFASYPDQNRHVVAGTKPFDHNHRATCRSTSFKLGECLREPAAQRSTGSSSTLCRLVAEIVFEMSRCRHFNRHASTVMV